MIGRADTRASDEQLMRRVQADDTEAFGLLYERLAASAYRVARRQCPNADRVHEVVQEGFASIWRSRHKYEPERGGVQTWALCIVRNRAIDSQRRYGPEDRRRSSEDENVEELSAPGDVHVDAVANDDARQLHALVAQLPLAQREVITLAYFDQLTHEEIAEQLTLPLGTVKGRMRLGMSKLRGQLDAPRGVVAEPASPRTCRTGRVEVG